MEVCFTLHDETGNTAFGRLANKQMPKEARSNLFGGGEIKLPRQRNEWKIHEAYIFRKCGRVKFAGKMLK